MTTRRTFLTGLASVPLLGLLPAATSRPFSWDKYLDEPLQLAYMSDPYNPEQRSYLTVEIFKVRERVYALKFDTHPTLPMYPLGFEGNEPVFELEGRHHDGPFSVGGTYVDAQHLAVCFYTLDGLGKVESWMMSWRPIEPPFRLHQDYMVYTKEHGCTGYYHEKPSAPV